MVARYALPTAVAWGALAAALHGPAAAFQWAPAPAAVPRRAPRSGAGARPAGGPDRPRFASRLAPLAAEEEGATARVTRRSRALRFLGLRRAPPPAGPVRCETVAELDAHYRDDGGRFRTRTGDLDHAALQAALSVEGDTQLVGAADQKDVVHPVVRLLHERRRAIEAARDDGAAVEGARDVRRTLPPDDGCKVALVVEGGGMRGCLTGGMVAAVHHLGLADAVDVVYGSSAGSVIGAYFVTRQLPWFGPEVYYDALTMGGDRFINKKRILRTLGLGLLDPRLLKDVLFRRNNGKPVLDLAYLLNTTMQENKPLDWDTFEAMQKDQPLKVVASGLKSERAFVMDMERGSFSSIEEMAVCMRASCLLPGLAGPLMNMKAPRADGTQARYDMRPGNKYAGEGYEPLADALLYEPLPYRSAIAEGATHVVCLRSRPDGVDVTGKSSVLERMLFRRFLRRKNELGGAYEHLRRGLHKRRYGEQVLELNAGARDVDRPYKDASAPHLLPVAAPPGSPEVGKLETGRGAIFEGVRIGFARCYDALVEDPDRRGKGMDVAKEVFPDSILDYDPREYASADGSAYAAYLRDVSGEGAGD